MPKIDQIDETPNPNAVKFVLKEPVTTGAARSFLSPSLAQDDALAKSLFEVGGVVSVFYMDRMITVEKEETEDWDDLLPKLAVPIRAAEAAKGGDAETDSGASPRARVISLTMSGVADPADVDR